ncbi:MAG: hypothetical protein JSU06_10325 [Actinobacteria bacterium]|nr:hypothetical protein [Actinomycetota bacterium]
MILEALAVLALAAVGVYALGGLLLRMAGLLTILAGLGATALGGGATGLLVAALGIPLWLLGRWVYGARHGAYRSPLAGLLLGLAPARLDPVRRRRG